jgi:hypothetical protein
MPNLMNLEVKLHPNLKNVELMPNLMNLEVKLNPNLKNVELMPKRKM